MFHILLLLVIYSMAISMFSDPGTISKEYINYFDMLRNIDRSNIYDPQVKSVIDNLLQTRRSTDLDTETLLNDLHESNANRENEREIIIDLNNNNPITMDSFQKMFNTDLNPNNNTNNLSNNVSNRGTIFMPDLDNSKAYFKSAEFFFKFYYYTRELSIENIKKNRNYCVFCKIIRPERSHHCKECRKSVLKMDYHCGVLNTCIGHYNYKPWITFVFYATSHLLLILTTMIDGINFYFDKTYYGKGTFECNVFLFTFGLIIIAFFSVGELFITHMLYI